MSGLGTQDLFERARSAIVDARRLSTTLQNVTTQRVAVASDVIPSSAVPAPAASGDVHPHSTTGDTSTAITDLRATDPHCQSAQSTLRKLVTVAQRLADLRDEHETTLSHLMHLRLQQLQLRQQQLSALHGLLQQQLSRLGDPEEAPLQRTRAAILSALSLLADCSADIKQLVLDCASQKAFHVVETVDAADQRADDISSLARRLLEILQSTTSADNACGNGLSQDRLNSLPRRRCTEGMLEQFSSCECPICLHSFCVGEEVSSLPCGHIHHHECLAEWLQIRASCPICKLPCPSGTYTLPECLQCVPDNSHRNMQGQDRVHD